MAKTKKQQMHDLIRHYKAVKNTTAVDMHEVAKFAADLGWTMPKPKSPVDLLAEQFSAAAREETRTDPHSGRTYRANLAVTTWQGKSQLTLWHDIDEAPRKIAHKSFVQRREQMVGDAVHLSLDVDHWNRVHPEDEPITMEMDFTEDVEWRLNAPSEEAA